MLLRLLSWKYMTEALNTRPFNDEKHSLKEVPLACVLDLDDTVIDTSQMLELFFPVAAKYGIASESLKEARLKAREDGGSLDVADYVISVIGRENWENLHGDFVDFAKENDLLLPGAQTALDSLAQSDVVYGFKTFGGPIWQPAKRDVAGIDSAIPMHVVNRKNKGEMMSARYDVERERFVIDWLGCVAAKVAMIDNDPTSFNGLEEFIDRDQVLALWIPHTDTDKSKPVIDGVVQVANLEEGMRELSKWSGIPELSGGSI